MAIHSLVWLRIFAGSLAFGRLHRLFVEQLAGCFFPEVLHFAQGCSQSSTQNVLGDFRSASFDFALVVSVRPFELFVRGVRAGHDGTSG